MTETEIFLTHLLDCRRIDLYTHQRNLNTDQQAQLDTMLHRRANGEPLQYITGQTNFMGYELDVNPHVLIPRPETEILIEKVYENLQLKRHESLFFLDLGVGSGNISIALAQHFKRAKIMAIDISQEAIKLAESNCKKHMVNNQIDFRQLSIFDVKEKFSQENHVRFDLVISNPPYIATDLLTTLPADVQQEPVLALDGGEQGLRYYQSIINQAPYILNKNGLLALEIGDDQLNPIIQLLEKNNHYTDIKHFIDYRNTPRIVFANLRNEG